MRAPWAANVSQGIVLGVGAEQSVDPLSIEPRRAVGLNLCLDCPSQGTFGADFVGILVHGPCGPLEPGRVCLCRLLDGVGAIFVAGSIHVRLDERLQLGW